MTMIWPCKITGTTYRMNGRKRCVSATIDGAGNVAGEVAKYMARLMAPWEWYGEEILAVTPLGQRVRVLIDPRQTIFSVDGAKTIADCDRSNESL